jgi:hypothetical protein
VAAFTNPQIRLLLTRVSALEAQNLNARLTALESGGGSTPVRPTVDTATYPNITGNQNSYTFTVTSRDNTQVFNNSVGTNGINVSSSNGYFQVPTLISKSPASANAAAITATYSISGAGGGNFADGTYTVNTLLGYCADVDGNTSLPATVGTFTVSGSSTGGGTPSTAPIYRDFTALSALPAGWVKSTTATATFGAGGLTVGKTGVQDFGVDFVRSPVFVPQDGQVITIDFQAPFEFSAVGLGNPTTHGQYQVPDAFLWRQTEIHNGQVPIETTTGYSAGANQRMRLTVHSGARTMLIELFRESSPGIYQLQRSYNRGIHSTMRDGTFILFDVFSGQVTIQRTTGFDGNQNYIDAAVIPVNYAGYNFDALALSTLAPASIDVVKLAASTRAVGTRALRVPGGDPSNYWNWDRGGLISDARPDANNDGGNGTRTPEPLPVWLRYEVSKTGFTIANFDNYLSQLDAGTEIVWPVNMLTGGGVTESALDKEVRHIEAAIAAGINIVAIELGNEFYFEIPNYVASTATGQQSLTTETVYANIAKTWAIRLKQEFPTLKVVAIGTEDNSNDSLRFVRWNAALNTANIWPHIDGITIHPYMNIAKLSAVLADVGNSSRAGEIAWDSLQYLRYLMASPSLGFLPPTKEIWLTERNIIEDPNNPETGAIVLGNSWIGSLILDLHDHQFLVDPRIKKSLVHTLLGNPQWEAISNEAGAAVDPTKRGNQANPVTDGLMSPLSPTMLGFVHKLSADIFNGGTGRLLAADNAYMAWQIDRTNGTSTISAVNCTNSTKTLNVPSSGNWNAARYTNAAWFSVTNNNQIPAPITSTVTSGGTYSIPPFTKAILTGNAGGTVTRNIVDNLINGANIGAGSGGGSSPFTTTIDFRGLSILPNDWTKSPSANLTFNNGMLISAGTTYGTNYVVSPILGIYDGRQIQIDFIGAAPSTAVGIGAPDTGGIFTANNAIVWFDSGGVWTGSEAVFSANSYGAGKTLRVLFIAFAGQWIVRFFHDLGSGFVQTHETAIAQNAQMSGFTRIYVDSGAAPIRLLAAYY